MKYLGPPQSGSVANETFARNRGGQYSRTRAGRGGSGDADFATLPGLWQSTLTDAQRQAWVLFARGRPVPGKLGQTIELTGFQWFVRVNRSLLVFGPGLQADPPPVPPGGDPVSRPLLLDAYFAAAVAHFTIDCGPSTQMGIVMDSTGIVSPGTMSAPGRGHYWKRLSQLFTFVVTPPFDWSTTGAWAGQYGAAPVTGEVVFFGMRTLDPLLFWGPRQVFRYVAP